MAQTIHRRAGETQDRLARALTSHGITRPQALSILRQLPHRRVAQQIDYYDYEVITRALPPEWTGIAWLLYRIRRNFRAPSGYRPIDPELTDPMSEPARSSTARTESADREVPSRPGPDKPGDAAERHGWAVPAITAEGVRDILDWIECLPMTGRALRGTNGRQVRAALESYGRILLAQPGVDRVSMEVAMLGRIRQLST